MDAIRERRLGNAEIWECVNAQYKKNNLPLKTIRRRKKK